MIDCQAAKTICTCLGYAHGAHLLNAEEAALIPPSRCLSCVTSPMDDSIIAESFKIRVYAGRVHGKV